MVKQCFDLNSKAIPMSTGIQHHYIIFKNKLRHFPSKCTAVDMERCIEPFCNVNPIDAQV